MNVWVGIEVTRQMRVAGGQMVPAGDLTVGGVNLLEHQIEVAKQVTSPDNICVLTPQGDEKMLDLVARHEVRELAPFDFIAMLSERAKHAEEGAVVLLRQIAPVRDASGVKKALKLLKKHPVVVSASKPPKGHPREDEPHCLAFEVRRISQFTMQAMADVSVEEELAFIDWNDFAEFIRPQDEPEVAAKVSSWKTSAAASG
jgi:hypothetical protein